MGTGPKIALGLVGTVLVLVLGLPIVAGLAKEGGVSGPPEPHWNNENLVGTTWVVQTERGEVTVTFQGGGVVQARHPLVTQFLNQPYLEGTWSVSGDKLNISATIPPPLNQNLSITATIEGKEIYGTSPEGERLEVRQLS